jgi:Na+/H+-dicarboxylate symporter
VTFYGFKLSQDREFGLGGSRTKMTDRASWVIIPSIVVATVLGGVFGYYLPEVAVSLGFLGRIFVSALKLVAMPLVFCAIIAGIASLRSAGRSGRVTSVALIYFAASSVLAVGIGLGVAYLIQPGVGVTLPNTGAPSWVASMPGAGNIIEGIIPSNVLGAISNGNLLGVVMLSIAIGFVLAGFGRRAKLVIDVVDIVYRAMIKLIGLLMYAAPLGLFFLVASIVGTNIAQVSELMAGLLSFLLTLVAGYAVLGLVALPLILWFLAGRNPVSYFINTIPALSTAFATASSATALPVTYDCVVERNNVDRGAGAIVLPLGASINMNGTAMFVTVAALFVAQAAGISLTLAQILLVAVVAAFVPAGLVGVPGAGIVVLVLAFRAADFPPAAYAGLGLLVSAEWLFDRMRSKINVWGDAVGAATVENLAVRVKAQQTRRPTEGRRPESGARRSSQSGRRQGRPTSSGSRSQGRDGRRGRPQGQHSRPERQDSRGGRQQQDSNRPDRRSSPQQPSGKQFNRSDSERRSSDDRRSPVAASPFEVPTEKNQEAPSRPGREQRPRPERSRSRSGPSGNDSRRRPPRVKEERPEYLSTETIDRERNKVAAQLDDMRQNELKLRDSGDRRPKPEPRRRPPRKPAEAPEPSFSKVDFSSDSSDSVPASATVVEAKTDKAIEPTPPRPEPTPPRPESAPEQSKPSGSKLSVKVAADDSRPEESSEPAEAKASGSFGRSRSRRGDAQRKRSQAGDKTDLGSDGSQAPPKSEESIPAENLTFGRSRKKRS